MSETKQTVICVAGMHRSGTSMIARLLNLCGMDLGPEADMMPATKANPEGYWEHLFFNTCNNEILAFFHGGWDLIPPYPPNWECDPRLAIMTRDAGTRIAAFTAPVWGWKDPRNSITLPFWKKLIPDLTTVICLRNPLDVAFSLNRRGSSSLLSGLRLWWQYNALLLRDTAVDRRAITHFDVYFRDGAAELQRLARHLGIAVSDAGIAQACSASKESLRHSLTDLDHLVEACPWPGLVRTYCRLLQESGEVCREVLGNCSRVEQFAAEWTPQDCDLAALSMDGEWRAAPARGGDGGAVLRQQLDAARQQQSELRQQLARTAGGLAEACAKHDELAKQYAEAIRQRDRTVADLRGVIAHRDQVLAELTKAVTERDQGLVELAKASAERDQIRADRAQVAAHRDQVLGELARTVTERDTARTELGEVVAHRDHLQGVVAQHSASLAALTAEIQAIKNSRGYKLLSMTGLLKSKPVA